MDKVYIAIVSWYETISYGDYDERLILGVFDAPCKAVRCIVEHIQQNDWDWTSELDSESTIDEVILDLNTKGHFSIETNYSYSYFDVKEYTVQ